VGQLFRLQLKIPGDGWLCVVQWGESGWFGLEIDDKAVVAKVEEGDCLLPPAPPYIKENEPGTRRYILMHSRHPFPEDLVLILRHSAQSIAPLNADTLVRLAHVVGADSVDMTALDIEFTEG
jgi:hypothetical protein